MRNSDKQLESSSFFSRFFLLFPYKLLKIFSKEKITEDLFFKLKNSLIFEKHFPEFQNYLTRQKNSKSYFKLFLKWLGYLWIHCFILFFIYNFIGIAMPFIIRMLINLFLEENFDYVKAYILCAILFGITIIKSFCLQHAVKITHEIGVKVNHIIIGTIFNKIKTMDLKFFRYLNSGQISSTVTLDVYRITHGLRTSHQLIIGPLMIIVNTIIIIVYVGWVGAIGVTFIIVFSILNFRFTKYSSIFMKKKLTFTDQRNKEVTNFVHGIKNIKFNTWENIILKKIDDIRKNEKYFIFRIFFLEVYSNFFSFINPIFATFLTISLKKMRNENLSLGDTYFIMMLFNMFVLPNRLFFFSYLQLLETRIIFKRFEHIINFPDVQENDDKEDEDLQKGEIIIQDGTFLYDDLQFKQKVQQFENIIQVKSKKNNQTDIQVELVPVLNNLNFKISSGELVAIVGKFGCGKTSFLKAITKSIFLKSGIIKKNGIISYVPQNSFLINETIKKNIVFDEEEQNEKLEKILKLTELEQDIKEFVGGIDTEIGERGINLSGGQKQRINIARAIFSDADIYLFDDCLSALDAKVGKKIFENVLVKYLSNKTRIFVTHSLHYLKDLDRVIFIDNGRIICEGSFEQLTKNNQTFQAFVSELKKKEQEEEEVDVNQSFSKLDSFTNSLNKVNSLKPPSTIFEIKNKGKLIKMEKQLEGVFDFKSFFLYFKKGGSLIFALVIFLFLIVESIRFFIDFWIGAWVIDKYNFINTTYFYVYLGSIIIIFCLAFITCFVYSYFVQKSAYNVFRDLISLLLKKKITYFDVTPIGQILNLTSKDTDFLDYHFPNFLQSTLSSLMRYLLTFIIMLTTSYLIFPFMAIYLLLSFLIIRIYIRISITLRRLEQNAYSPVISNIKEFFEGIVIIRTLKKFGFCEKIFTKNINQICTIFYHDNCIHVFVILVLEMITGFIVIITFLFFITAKVFDWTFVIKDNNLIALSLNYMFLLVLMFNTVSFFFLETIKSFTSLQRLFKNVDNTLLEKSYETPLPPKDWPKTGKINFNNVHVRYQDHLPPILNGLFLNIKSGEKIGVLGRTGSGKSTLLLTLTRILELDEDKKNSAIEIDDINISEIGLKNLRKEIGVIPQEPFLITGSLRYNLDPYNEFNDKEIIDCLKKCLLWYSDLLDVKDYDKNLKKSEKNTPDNIKNDNYFETNEKNFFKNDVERKNDETTEEKENEKKLSFLIENRGSNLSEGEKQLICLSRALLRKPKILLMDEATSNIDQKTDYTIQKIIKEEFRNSTLITIAHRINTIIFYDKVVILQDGKIVENGVPYELLLTKKTIFRNMVKELGKDFFQKMVNAAEKKDILFFNA